MIYTDHHLIHDHFDLHLNHNHPDRHLYHDQTDLHPYIDHYHDDHTFFYNSTKPL